MKSICNVYFNDGVANEISIMQLEFFGVPSPCVGVCQSNEKGYCRGCMRTRDERQNWMNFDSNDKQKVIRRCIQRKKRQKNQSISVEVNSEPEKEQEIEQPSLLDPPKKVVITKESDLDFGDFEL